MARDLRKPLTEEQKKEAARLKDLFSTHSVVSQEEFGSRFRIGTQGHVSQYLNGKRALSLTIAVKFAHGLNVPIDAFSPRLAAELHGLPLGSALESLVLSMEAQDAMETLDFLEFKLGRSRARRVGEPPVEYGAAIDRLRDQIKSKSDAS